jgi:hypothetical protein
LVVEKPVFLNHQSFIPGGFSEPSRNERLVVQEHGFFNRSLT